MAHRNETAESVYTGRAPIPHHPVFLLERPWERGHPHTHMVVPVVVVLCESSPACKRREL